MYGIVLCGGQSSRMGSDKSLLVKGGKCWAQIAAEKLGALQIPVKLSINKKQQVAYETFMDVSDLILDDNNLLVNGPLLGLLSCHLAFPKEDLLIVACDMLHMETHLLIRLYNNYLLQNAEACLFNFDKVPEPLCAIYTAVGLARVLHMHQTKKLHKHSMKFVLEHLQICNIELPVEEKKYFQNFNLPEDIY